MFFMPFKLCSRTILFFRRRMLESVKETLTLIKNMWFATRVFLSSNIKSHIQNLKRNSELDYALSLFTVILLKQCQMRHPKLTLIVQLSSLLEVRKNINKILEKEERNISKVCIQRHNTFKHQNLLKKFVSRRTTKHHIYELHCLYQS